MDLQQSKLLDLHRNLGHTVFELKSLRTPGAQYASPRSVNRNVPSVVVEVLD